MARKFLYFIAGVTVLIIAVLLALRLWSNELTEITFVPDVDFTPQSTLAVEAYDNPSMWVSHPKMEGQDPARWLPKGFADDGDALNAAVFFVHPTTFFNKSHWNAPEGDTSSLERTTLFVQGMASPFNKAAEIWAPYYRQATVGAFLTSNPDGAEALNLAYGDVQRAFDSFVKAIPTNRPIVLVGHSQGAFHLRRLIHERIAGTPLEKRIAMAYLIGWPISWEHDIPKMGLPACTQAAQQGCIVSWLSVAEPADTSMMLKTYARQQGLDGQQLNESPFICTNPLTGASIDKTPIPTESGTPSPIPTDTQTAAAAEEETAPVSANTGTLIPDLLTKSGTLQPGKVGARCREDGFLSIGDPQDLNLGPFVMPGNNYHLFDITLFWNNLRSDFANRLKSGSTAK